MLTYLRVFVDVDDRDCRCWTVEEEKVWLRRKLANFDCALPRVWTCSFQASWPHTSALRPWMTRLTIVNHEDMLRMTYCIIQKSLTRSQR